MRLIYLLAVGADHAASAEIESLLKQRGYFVRRAEEKFAFPPARPNEITLALWSQSVQFSQQQILFTNRAIDAWTEGRLILARLDNTFQPRGLGDVEAIDLTFAPARMAAVWKIVEAAQGIDRVLETRRKDAPPEPGPAASDGSAPSKAEPPASEPKPKRTSARGFSSSHATIAGLVAAGAFASFGFLSLPAAPSFLLGLAAALWGMVAGTVAGFVAGGEGPVRSSARDAARAAPARPAPGSREVEHASEFAMLPADPAAPVFVSYSRHDGSVVHPLVAELEASGQDVWIDRDELQPGTHWAGRIVEAIRGSDTFCLMCSVESFQSDNVRREVYIADKYKRKLLPVRLDSAEMPADFEYFLIDRQWLDLTTADEAERVIRLKAALGR
jgi:hypothetical protein